MSRRRHPCRPRSGPAGGRALVGVQRARGPENIRQDVAVWAQPLISIKVLSRALQQPARNVSKVTPPDSARHIGHVTVQLQQLRGTTEQR
jgi:hypothetical protein